MKVAIYARVSTDEQHQLNQVPVLEQWAAARKFEVVNIYRDVGSAWQNADQANLKAMIADARRGMFEVILVWSLDRITRGGPGKIVPLIQKLSGYGVRIYSYQESWTEQPTQIMYELLLSVFSWYANFESQRISERTKAGMERARAQGKNIGRPPGKKDKKRRQRSGYYLRHKKGDGNNDNTLLDINLKI